MGVGKQVKSKQRVKDLGEVFTNEREVKAMLDLIPNLTAQMTFLEPTCGNGNFLVEILKRKIDLYQGDKKDTAWATHILDSYGSIYAIDLMEDNVKEARERMFQLLPEDLMGLAPIILLTLEQNIRVGDFLKITGVDVNDKSKKKNNLSKEEIQKRLTDFFLYRNESEK